MISLLTTAAPVKVCPEDTDICCGIIRNPETGELKMRPNKTHAFEVARMQDGDRADYARILSLVDSGEE